MARLSKSKAFAIYEDVVVQDFEHVIPEQEEANEVNDDNDCTSISKDDRAPSVLHHEASEAGIHGAAQDREGEDADDERRESTITSTTVSSFPDSYYLTEHEDGLHTYHAYTPPVIRPRFRRPEWMASPPPYGYRSPRLSLLSHSRSRAGTPRSARSVNTRGSPRAKNRSTEEDDLEQKHYPLVLLHVSLLPLNAPWSLESMQDWLPAETLASLQLLRSKLSETVLRRGLLIPHPREEYELLEERLLEAMELKTERLTKCGHFCGRSSGSSEHGAAQSDSGIGSCSDSSDDELCAICQKHIQLSKSGVTSGNKKWIIRVYAANGLMRSSAWAAAWADMERVDVEIMPWISDEVRQSLDELKTKEDAEKQRLLLDQDIMIRETVTEQVRITLEEWMPGYARPPEEQLSSARPPYGSIIPESRRLGPPADDRDSSISNALATNDLPQIYKPSQIPISVLLKNYIYLLLQDRRILAVFGLSIAILFYAISLSTTPKHALVPDGTIPNTPGPSPISALTDAIRPSNTLQPLEEDDLEPGVSSSYLSTGADVVDTRTATYESSMLGDLDEGHDVDS